MMTSATELTVGATAVDPRQWSQPFVLSWLAAPDQVGLADVSRLQGMTAQLRALDHEHGGGACRDAVLSQVAWAQQLLRGRVGEDAEHELHLGHR